MDFREFLLRNPDFAGIILQTLLLVKLIILYCIMVIFFPPCSYVLSGENQQLGSDSCLINFFFLIHIKISFKGGNKVLIWANLIALWVLIFSSENEEIGLFEFQSVFRLYSVVPYRQKEMHKNKKQLDNKHIGNFPSLKIFILIAMILFKNSY